MTPSTSKAALSGPELSAEELDVKLLSLIKGITQPEALSKANVERLTGLSLIATPPASTKFWAVEGAIRNAGTYTFGFDEYSPDDRRVQIQTGSAQRYDPGTAQPCTLTFQALHDRLKTMGYQDTELFGPHGRPQAWQFWKGRQSLVIDYAYNAPAAEGGIRCISKVMIEAILD